MSRRLTGCVLVVLLLPACISRYDQRPVDVASIQPGRTTKRELLEVFGAPDGVRAQGADTVLVFRFSDTNGRGWGLGAVAVRFAVEATHTGVDVLEVVVGPDRVVRSFRTALVPRETPAWPGE